MARTKYIRPLGVGIYPPFELDGRISRRQKKSLKKRVQRVSILRGLGDFSWSGEKRSKNFWSFLWSVHVVDPEQERQHEREFRRWAAPDSPAWESTPLEEFEF